MQPAHLLMIAATSLILSSTSVLADNTVTFDPLLMRECPQADGTALYTNKDLPGCKLMTLKELSVVPSLENMPTYRPTVAAAPHYDIPPYVGRQSDRLRPAGNKPSPIGLKIGMPASPRRDRSRLKSVRSMENGCISTRKLEAGSFTGQTHRMAEICREEISAGRAIRSTTMLATSHCPAFLGEDLCRSAVRNESSPGEKLMGCQAI